MPHWFFMSYARVDDEHRGSGRVNEFFKNLEDEVAIRTEDPPNGQVAYLDQYDLNPGDAWPNDLAQAAQQCRTFIPIMTARYFRREYCGREWQIFEDRLRDSAQSRGNLPPLILPVPWVFPEEGKFPEFASSLHTAISLKDVAKSERDQVADYASKGLLHVMKRKETTHQAAYDTILVSLAVRIIRLAKEHPLPALAGLRSLNKVENRFAAVGARARPVVADHASFRAFFIVMAARQHELNSEMQPVADRYGPNCEDWKPYYPDDLESIGLVAQRQATQEGLIVKWIAADDQLPERLRQAEASNSAAVMVVDPWSIGLRRYEGILRDIDQLAFVNCVVLVPWGPAVGEGAQNEARLRARLEQVLRRRVLNPLRLYLRDDIRTSEQLADEISASLREVQAILAPRRDPVRPSPKGRFSSPPTVGTQVKD